MRVAWLRFCRERIDRNTDRRIDFPEVHRGPQAHPGAGRGLAPTPYDPWPTAPALAVSRYAPCCPAPALPSPPRPKPLHRHRVALLQPRHRVVPAVRALDVGAARRTDGGRALGVGQQR